MTAQSRAKRPPWVFFVHQKKRAPTGRPYNQRSQRKERRFNHREHREIAKRESFFISVQQRALAVSDSFVNFAPFVIEISLGLGCHCMARLAVRSKYTPPACGFPASTSRDGQLFRSISDTMEKGLDRRPPIELGYFDQTLRRQRCPFSHRLFFFLS